MKTEKTINELWQHRQTVEKARNVDRLRKYNKKLKARFALYEAYNNG